MPTNKFYFHKARTSFDALNYDVYIVVTNSIAKACAKIKSEEVDPDDHEGTAAMAIHEKNKGKSWVIVTPRSTPGDIAHECWHVVRYVFNYINSGFENEMVAYHIGYLVDKVVSFQKHAKTL